MDEVRDALADTDIKIEYKEFAFRKAVMNNHAGVIDLLAAQQELKSIVLEEFEKAMNKYWLKEKKVKLETVEALTKHVGRAVVQSHLDGDNFHDDLRPVLERALHVDITKILLKMEKWNVANYEHAYSVMAQHGAF